MRRPILRGIGDLQSFHGWYRSVQLESERSEDVARGIDVVESRPSTEVLVFLCSRITPRNKSVVVFLPHTSFHSCQYVDIDASGLKESSLAGRTLFHSLNPELERPMIEICNGLN